MTALRPGEIKILKSLQQGDKSFSDLKEETHLADSILSKYLKGLQKVGLIARDIDTRKYQIKPISTVALFYKDISDFMRERLEKMITEGMEKAGVIPASVLGWLVLTDRVGLRDNLERALEDPEVHMAFLKIYNVIEGFYDSYVLSLYKGKKKRIIETYGLFLGKCVKMMRVQPIEEKYTKHIDEIYRPDSLEDLYFTLKWLRDHGECKNDLTEKEVNELKEMHDFLADPRNRKIYEEYRQRVADSPKTLVFYPSWGFKGYLKELKALFPKAKEK